MKEYKGHYQGRGCRIGIVVSRFNATITQQLLEGALDGLTRHGVDPHDIHVVWVPGAYEIPLVTQRLAASESFDALLCLGAVIRGATAHFDYVAGEAAAGIARLSLQTERPIVFGILTTDTVEQALERSGIKNGNKGFEAALCALEMIDLLKKLPEPVRRISFEHTEGDVHTTQMANILP